MVAILCRKSSHGQGPVWPATVSQQVDAWISGIWCLGVGVGHSVNMSAGQQSIWAGWSALSYPGAWLGAMGGHPYMEESAPLDVHLHSSTKYKIGGGDTWTSSLCRSEN